MPQVDLESLVCGGDPKIACETTLNPSQPDPELPAESFLIPISGNLEYWLDINPVYDRDDSTKGTTNPKSHFQHHQQQQQGPNVNSQRFSGNLKATAKAPIIALPNKIQHHSGYLGHNARTSQARIFPKKKTVRASDPGSPKVSLFGKVLSGREKSQRRSPGCRCWAVFRCFGRRREAAADGGLGSGTGKNVAVRERKVVSMAAPAVEPPGIGGMKRFASGRRSASWGGDVAVEVEEGKVAWSGPLDRR